MSWIRVDTDIEMDRTFRKLDGFGRAVIQFIWRLAKKKEGRISGDDWDHEYIADMVKFPSNLSEIKEAMSDILKLKMVEPFEGGGDFFVSNWDKYQKPKDKTNAERQRRFREKQKESNDSNAVTAVMPVTVTRNGVHTDIHTGQDIHTDIHTSSCAESVFTAPRSGIEKQICEALGKRYKDRLLELKPKTIEKLIVNLSSDIFSGVDVPLQIEAAAIWEDSNPTRRKTAKGVSRFLTGWMNSEQNRGQRRGAPARHTGNANLDGEALESWGRIIQKMRKEDVNLLDIEKQSLKSIGKSTYDLAHSNSYALENDRANYIKSYKYLKGKND